MKREINTLINECGTSGLVCFGPTAGPPYFPTRDECLIIDSLQAEQMPLITAVLKVSSASPSGKRGAADRRTDRTRYDSSICPRQTKRQKVCPPCPCPLLSDRV